MFKAIHALKFKELQVETLVEHCVILHKLYSEGLLVRNVHTMQHESVSVRPAYTRLLVWSTRTSDRKAESVLQVAHFGYRYKVGKPS